MALRRQVVNFIWLRLLNNMKKARAVCHVAMMKKKTHIFFVAVLIKMIDPIGVKQAGTSLNPMNYISLI